ncbi:MAG: class I SAM-dependent methyltransferase [Pseudomonadota bacterium]
MTHAVIGEHVRSRPVTPNSILAEMLDHLVLLHDQGETGSDAFSIGLAEVQRLASGLEGYVRKSSSPESVALQELSNRTATHNWDESFASGETGHALEQEMLSGQVEGQLLQILIRSTKAHRVLDIGMFTGYSSLAMAEALPENGEVIACELDPYVAQFAQESFSRSTHADKIKVHVGPALQTINRLADGNERFDFVFIDAEKTGYIDYLCCLLDREMLTEAALICVDNTLMQGEPYTAIATEAGRAITQFNEFVSSDSRVRQVMLPLRDGVTLIQRVD